MNITRHNYEEYFILYLDNELSSDERRQVEIFVQENADLKQELNWLLQTRLVPEASIIFDGKEGLLRKAGDVINETNYEEWLVLYIDNELTTEQKAIADQLIAKNSPINTELELLQKTKLQPEPQIIFKNKETLYRREEKVRVISLQWRRIAVAAVLLITIGTAFFLTLNNKDNSAPVAKGDAIKTKTPVTTQPKKETIDPTNSIVAENSEENSNDAIAKGESNKSVKKVVAPVERNSIDNVLTKEEKKVSVANNVIERRTNNLSLPTSNPNVNSELKKETVVVKIDPVEKKDLTIFKENRQFAVVTPDKHQTFENVETALLTQTVEPIEEEQPGKKNKLRGFFRKVTRTIEKRTNIKATDDEDRLLLAGFAVKL